MHTLCSEGAAFALVDVFAERLHSGNPAGVVRLRLPEGEGALAELPAAPLQAIAAEVNAPATAFISPSFATSGGVAFDIRWFSSAAELPLCGHATMGAAKSLLAAGVVAPTGTSTLFSFRSHLGGLLRVKAFADDPTLELSLESLPPAPADVPGIAAALGVREEGIAYVGRNRYDVLVELGSAAAVEGLRPSQERLAAISARGFIVTAAGGCERAPDADFTSRFFGPSMGIPEDPATGSAQCALAPYWIERLGRQLSPQPDSHLSSESPLTPTVRGFQASARGGGMGLSLAAEQEEEGGGVVERERVVLSSQAQLVLRGDMALPPELC